MLREFPKTRHPAFARDRIVRISICGVLLSLLSVMSLTAVYACQLDLEAPELEISAPERAIVAQAIKNANLITGLSGEPDLILYRMDKPPPHPSSSIPVMLVGGGKARGGAAIGVPSKTRCIVIRPSLLREWLNPKLHSAVGLEVQLQDILVFMLLHEIGHIRSGQQNVSFENGELRQLNIDPTRAKQQEKDADAYAASMINAAISGRSGDPSVTAGLYASLALSNLSWNLQANRMLDNFGASSVGAPEVYFDSGLTHPNLSWRVLSANFLISKSLDAEFLLRDFESTRDLGSRPMILYERDSGGANIPNR